MSDHKSLNLDLSIHEKERGKGYWKLNIKYGTRNLRFGMQGKKNSYSSVVVMEISEMKYMFILV